MLKLPRLSTFFMNIYMISRLLSWSIFSGSVFLRRLILLWTDLRVSEASAIIEIITKFSKKAIDSNARQISIVAVISHKFDECEINYMRNWNFVLFCWIQRLTDMAKSLGRPMAPGSAVHPASIFQPWASSSRLSFYNLQTTIFSENLSS